MFSGVGFSSIWLKGLPPGPPVSLKRAQSPCTQALVLPWPMQLLPVADLDRFALRRIGRALVL